MTRRQGEDSHKQPPQRPTPVTAGLLVRGAILRRWRKTLGNGTEVVNYDVGGVVVTVYRPDGYYPVGEAVELPVSVSLWQSKAGPRYSLTMTATRDGEF
jgi:hypothetical protein